MTIVLVMLVIWFSTVLVGMYIILSQQKERQDLLNRIMARDYREYLHATNTADLPKAKPNFMEKAIRKAYASLDVDENA